MGELLAQSIACPFFLFAMKKEIWRPVTTPIDFTGFYEISNFGRLKSCPKRNKIDGRQHPARIIKCFPNDKGYVKADLHRNGEEHRFSLHRLVGLHFIPNPEKLPEINHIDFNKSNNRADNLEWTTPKGNMDHYYSSDRVVRGKSSSKLSESDVIFIRKNFWIFGVEKLAERFLVSKNCILNAATGRKWAHVDYPSVGEISRRIIIDINAGVFYESVNELSKLIGKSPKEIHRRLNGERPNNTPYRYC